MHTQTIQFATVTKNGVVQKVGRSTIVQPKTNFKGGSIKCTCLLSKSYSFSLEEYFKRIKGDYSRNRNNLYSRYAG